MNLGDPFPNALLRAGTPYEVLTHVQAARGDDKLYIGTRGACRYCGCTAPTLFATEAHTFPEGLGNRWVFSRDECDQCNEFFSKYETALAASIGAFLTFGGVKGKDQRAPDWPDGRRFVRPAPP